MIFTVGDVDAAAVVDGDIVRIIEQAIVQAPIAEGIEEGRLVGRNVVDFYILTDGVDDVEVVTAVYGHAPWQTDRFLAIAAAKVKQEVSLGVPD